MNHEAVYALYPNAVSIRGDVVLDVNENEITIDRVLVDGWVSPTQYRTDRAAEYPPIGDQLDALFHAGVFPAEMATQIQAVKDKYPKES